MKCGKFGCSGKALSTKAPSIILTTLLAILFLLLAAGCSEKSKDKSINESTKPSTDKSGSVQSNTHRAQLPKDERGNSIGNTANAGLVAQKGDWIFYCNPNNGSLNKMKSDGTNETVLFERSFYEINVIGDWIYCSDEDGYKYYKIKTNGSGRIKLSDDECYDVNIVDNWIYYVSDDSKIHKMDLNGKNKTKLNNDDSSRLNVVNGWIYFCKADKQANNGIGDTDWLPCGKIYKMRIDGTKEKLVCDSSCSFVNVQGSWIYYSDVDDNLRLYKLKIDGTGKTKLSDDSSYDINVTDDYIYYSNMMSLGQLYRIDLNGKGKIQIGDFEGKCWDANVTSDYLFFNYWPNGLGEKGFYRMKLNGEEKTKV